MPRRHYHDLDELIHDLDRESNFEADEEFLSDEDLQLLHDPEAPPLPPKKPRKPVVRRRRKPKK